MKRLVRSLFLGLMLLMLAIIMPVTATEYNLYCGKTDLAGHIDVTGTGTAAEPIIVTYSLDDPSDSIVEEHWAALLTDPRTNLLAWKDLKYVTKKGNAIPGQFPNEGVVCSSGPCGTKYVAAHAVAELCDRLNLNVPTSADIYVNCAYESTDPSRIDFYGDKSYVDILLGSTWMDAWCADTDFAIVACEWYYDAEFYPTVTADIVHPEYQCVNFLLNNREGSYSGETWTKANWEEFQAALWIVLGEATEGDFPIGDVDPDFGIVNAMLEYADDNDCESFVPACGDMVAVSIYPGEEVQPLIIAKPLKCTCTSETCWAGQSLVDGRPTIQFPGNDWSSFVVYPPAA